MKVSTPTLLAGALFSLSHYAHGLPLVDTSNHSPEAVSSAHVVSSKEPPSAESVVLMDTRAEAGNSTVRFFDESRLEAEFLSVLRQRDERAYEYLFSAMETLHQQLEGLSKTRMALRKLADKSLLSMVPAEDYLAEVRHYEEQMVLVADKITTLAMFPSLKQDKRAELSAGIQFDALEEHYRQQLDIIQRQVEGMQFRLKLPGESLHVQQGVNFDSLQGLQLLSAEKINEMQRSIVRKRFMSTREKNVIDQGINEFTEKALRTFIATFGTEERYRTSSDESGRKEAAEALAEAFWARFYIRATYGIKIGSIPVGYTKSIFNADYFLSDMTIGHIPVWSSPDLTVARNRAREARASMKDTSRSWAHWLRDASIWLGGSQAQETAKKFVIELLQTDLDQELQLGTSGGLKRVREAYRQRFYTSDDQKTLYQAREDRVFGSADADDAEADVAYNDAGTLPGVIATCRNTLEQMEVRLEEADRLQRSLDAILGDSKTQQRRKKRSQL